jgi:PHP domain.
MTLKVNAHLHTPYSFSAFESIDQALDMAKKEGVKVVGINDFYTPDGYQAWAEGCKKRALYPLFNIEFISLNEEDQKAGLRVNDPGNPGRTYLSGKGLSFPFKLEEPYASQLAAVRAEANAQVEAMCGKVNELLNANNAGFTLDFEILKKELTEGSVRERHLAKALRLQASANRSEEEIKTLFEKLFGGKALKASVSDHAAVENEIRGNLLKAGGTAFVPEDPKAFLPMETVRQIILKAGGIPTYPFLADDTKGAFTDFECDIRKAASTLKERGFYSAEFITTRNTMDALEIYAEYLVNNGFIVTFGSEHNTPAMEPITLTSRSKTPLSKKLQQINYQGACVIAAHQHFVKNGQPGYVNAEGIADVERRDEFIKLGKELIENI